MSTFNPNNYKITRQAMYSTFTKAKNGDDAFNFIADKTFIESYVLFVTDNIDHIVIFLVPIILFVITLIFSLNHHMLICKKLKQQNKKLRQKNSQLATLTGTFKRKIDRTDSLIDAYKLYGENQMHMLRLLKEKDESVFFKLKDLCKKNDVAFPTEIPSSI